MEELIQLVKKEAPFILDKIIAIDVIQKDFNVIPVLFVSIGNGIGLVPIVNGEMPAIYLPDEDKYLPLTEEILESISSESDESFLPATPQNVNDNPNLYNMIRPPSSGRAVYAEESPKVVTEPISKEFFEFGFVIVDPRKKEEAPKIFVNPVETLLKFSTPELGKPQVIFTIDGEPVKAVIFRDSDADNYLIISEIGVAHKVTKLPVACNMSCGCWPEYEPSDRFVVVYEDKYWDTPDETFFGPEDVVVFSNNVTKPIITSSKAIFPAKYQKVYVPVKEIPVDTFANDPVFIANILSSRCVRISYLGGDEFLINKSVLPKVDAAKVLLEEFGLHGDDIYQIIKIAQEEGSLDVYISKMEESIKDVDPEDLRKEELIDAFDSQVRILLNNYLENLDTSRVMEIIKALTTAIVSFLK